MATIKFDYTGKCAGGGHAFLRVLVDNTERCTLAIASDDMIDPKRITADEAEGFLLTLLKLHRRKWLRLNPSGTAGQYITALEAEDWEI